MEYLESLFLKRVQSLLEINSYLEYKVKNRLTSFKNQTSMSQQLRVPMINFDEACHNTALMNKYNCGEFIVNLIRKNCSKIGKLELCEGRFCKIGPLHGNTDCLRINNTHFHINVSHEIGCKLSCNSTDKIIIVPMISLIKIPVECALYCNPNFFIEKLSIDKAEFIEFEIFKNYTFDIDNLLHSDNLNLNRSNLEKSLSRTDNEIGNDIVQFSNEGFLSLDFLNKNKKEISISSTIIVLILFICLIWCCRKYLGCSGKELCKTKGRKSKDIIVKFESNSPVIQSTICNKETSPHTHENVPVTNENAIENKGKKEIDVPLPSPVLQSTPKKSKEKMISQSTENVSELNYDCDGIISLHSIKSESNSIFEESLHTCQDYYDDIEENLQLNEDPTSMLNWIVFKNISLHDFPIDE